MAIRQLHVLFRVDASKDIGSGHVVRCLTLANALAERGARCTFLCRALQGNMIDQISAAGHDVQALAVANREGMRRTDDGDYAAWLGISIAEDARDCRAVIKQLAPDRVVVDHYALDKVWEMAACGTVPVMVIDDLANRAHHCDILLDQNLGRKSYDYDGLVPDSAIRILGPKHALLRPEFAAARAGNLARRSRDRPLRSLLIAMGGVDRDNATGSILDVLSALPICRELKISVVMGSGAPWLDQVCQQVVEMPCPAELYVDVNNMASLLSDADLAIGAAGGSAWERCCVGVPTLMLTLADNQKPGAQALAEKGAAHLLGDFREKGWRGALMEVLQKVALNGVPTEMSGICGSLVDGIGAPRAADKIHSHWLKEGDCK